MERKRKKENAAEAAKERKKAKTINRLVNKEKLTYNNYYRFISRLSNRQSVKFSKISNFIDNTVTAPKEKIINLDYIEIKWTQVSKLRDEVGLDEASLVQKDLEKYVNQFDSKNEDVLRAKTRITTHPIVMYQIQQDIKNGKKLVLESLEIAKSLKDKELQIVFLYHLTDFLILEGNLQEYINVSEKSLALEKSLAKQTSYYYSTIEHLIDAYAYKGGNNDRVIHLINILYKNKYYL